jgi:hypothetical protein
MPLGGNVAHSNSRGGAFHFESLSQHVWVAARTGYGGSMNVEQNRWNVRARNVFFEAIDEQTFK